MKESKYIIEDFSIVIYLFISLFIFFTIVMPKKKLVGIPQHSKLLVSAMLICAGRLNCFLMLMFVLSGRFVVVFAQKISTYEKRKRSVYNNDAQENLQSFAARK